MLLRQALAILLLLTAFPAHARGTAGIGWALLTVPLVWPIVLFVLALEPTKSRALESSPLPILLLLFLVFLVSPFTVGLAQYFARLVGASGDAAAWVLLSIEVATILIVVGYRRLATRWLHIQAKSSQREPPDA